MESSLWQQEGRDCNTLASLEAPGSQMVGTILSLLCLSMFCWCHRYDAGNGLDLNVKMP